MKKYLVIILFLAASIISCENYLEEKNYSVLGGNIFPATIDDAEVMINGAYHRGVQTATWAHRLDWLVSYSTPELMYKNRELHPYRGTSDSWSWELDPVYLWNWLGVPFQCIRSCNDVIGLLPDVDIKEPRKSQIIAEAKFIRANMYFYLVRMLGPLPIIDKANKLSDDIFPAQSSIAEVYDFIVQDLKDAEADCPTREETISQGRLGAATKGAAAGMLAKVYVTMATKPLEDASKWEMAKAQIDKVKTMGYSLVTTSFADLYDWKNENNEEFLFSWQSEGNLQREHAYHYYAPRDVHDDHRIWMPVGQSGINYDLCEPEFAEWVYSRSINSVGDTSQRAKYAITLSYIDKNGNKRMYNGGPQDAAYCSKFRMVDYAANANNTWPTNKPVLRYADILLLESEILNELGTGDKYAGINEVRQRAGLDPVPAGLSKDDFREAVFDERKLELCFEQDMFFDMRRRGYEYSKNIMENYYNPDQNGYQVGFAPSVEPHELLFPWPQQWLDDNPNLVQTPGY